MEQYNRLFTFSACAICIFCGFCFSTRFVVQSYDVNKDFIKSIFYIYFSISFFVFEFYSYKKRRELYDRFQSVRFKNKYRLFFSYFLNPLLAFGVIYVLFIFLGSEISNFLNFQSGYRPLATLYSSLVLLGITTNYVAFAICDICDVKIRKPS